MAFSKSKFLEFSIFINKVFGCVKIGETDFHTPKLYILEKAMLHLLAYLVASFLFGVE